MQEYIDDRTLAVIGLFATNGGLLTFLFYHPKDLLPSTYDALKWMAVVHFVIGLLILSYLAPILFFVLLPIAYAVAYTESCKQYPDHKTQDYPDEILFQSTVFPIGAFLGWLFLRYYFPFVAPIPVLVLAGVYVYRVYDVLIHVEANEEAELKRIYVTKFLSQCMSPLSELLCRYHPSWYPPPINRRMESAIKTYASFIRDLYDGNGTLHSDKPDDALIQQFRRFSDIFPTAWNYEQTTCATMPILDILDMFSVTTALTLEENQQYETQLTAYFKAKTPVATGLVEAQLPEHIVQKIKGAFKELKQKFETSTPAQEIADIDARLTALIPDYIAKTYTVIGTPPNSLPLVYDSLESRYRHTFLIGSSGAGKSTVITNLVTQDMHKGNGVIVMSPDQKLLRDLVPYIPEHRLDDVIYFDPNDTVYPIIGFNPFFFETPAHLKPQDRDYKTLRDNTVQETYAVLERTLQINTEPTQRLLNNALYALTGRPNTTFRDLSRLIDPAERAFHMEIVSDPRVDNETRKFWQNYASERANAMVYRTLSDRIMPLLRSSLSEVFSTQSFSFHRELNERARIFLIDLSTFGSRTSREAKIAAQLLIPTIHQSLFRRNALKESDYIPYFMYIDEFQHFANTNEETINDMAEQTRKFHVGLTLTSLVASDLSPKLLDTINGVMRTKICLNISAKDARLFASELLIKRGGRDSYDPEALQTLGIGEAYVKTPPNTAAVFVKLPKEPVGSQPTASITFEQLKRRSKANFGALEKPLTSVTEDPDIPFENVEEPPDIPQAPKQQVQSDTPKKEPPKRTSRRKRSRFDEDAGEPEIEIS